MQCLKKKGYLYEPNTSIPAGTKESHQLLATPYTRLASHGNLFVLKLLVITLVCVGSKANHQFESYESTAAIKSAAIKHSTE
jgi:hypothetical protein